MSLSRGLFFCAQASSSLKSCNISPVLSARVSLNSGTNRKKVVLRRFLTPPGNQRSVLPFVRALGVVSSLIIVAVGHGHGHDGLGIDGKGGTTARHWSIALDAYLLTFLPSFQSIHCKPLFKLRSAENCIQSCFSSQ